MTRFLSMLPVIAAAVMFYCMVPMQHSAQPAAQTNDDPITNTTSDATPSTGDVQTLGQNGGAAVGCSTITEAKGGLLIGKIVPCLVYTITNATQAFSQSMTDWMRPIFYSFLTLVVTLFGVRVLQAEHDLHAHAFVFVLKVAFVIGMFEMIPTTVVPAAYGIMSGGVNIVTKGIINSSAFTLNCKITDYGDANTLPLWEAMDCVLGKLYGFATGTDPNTGAKTTNMLLASSAVGLLSGFFFGGTFGVAVFFALIGVLWTVVSLILRTVMAFLSGYLMVCVLLLLSPLFLPLVLLKVTNDYFEKWWRAIFGALLMPTLIASYSMFALMAYDQVLFKQGSLMQKLFDYPTIQGALKQDAPLCDMTVTGDPTSKAPKDADKDTLDNIFKNNPFVQNFSNSLLSGANNACGSLQKTVFDVSKVNDAAFADKKKAMYTIFIQSVELLLIALILAEGVKAAEGAVTSMTGSSSVGTALHPQRQNQVESALQTRFDRSKQSMVDEFQRTTYDKDGAVVGTDYSASGASGSEFLKRFPTAASGFLGGVIRN